MPIQPGGARSVRGSVEIRPKSVAGIRDLEVFSYSILIYAIYHCNGYTPEVKPSLDPEIRGIFATRAPRLPNAIRLSIVRLIGIKRTMLDIEDVDFLDGTPLLGIKPYVPAFDSCCEAKAGWFRRPLVFSYPTTLRFDTRKKQPVIAYFEPPEYFSANGFGENSFSPKDRSPLRHPCPPEGAGAHCDRTILLLTESRKKPSE